MFAYHGALTSILDRYNRDRVANILGATPQKWTSEGEVSLTAGNSRGRAFRPVHPPLPAHVPPPKPSKVRCLNRVLSMLGGGESASVVLS